MKKVLGLIGIELVAGAVIYVLLNRKEKAKKSSGVHSENNPETFSADNTVSIITPNDTRDDGIEYEEKKASAAESIHARHEEASNIMRKAVEIICKRSEISENENRDLEQISDELDELLGEE